MDKVFIEGVCYFLRSCPQFLRTFFGLIMSFVMFQTFLSPFTFVHTKVAPPSHQFKNQTESDQLGWICFLNIPTVKSRSCFQMLNLPRMEWQNNVTEKVKGMLVTNPGMSPSSIRVDQLDREQVSTVWIRNPNVSGFRMTFIFWMFKEKKSFENRTSKTSGF